jgi:hypothetical protein
MTAAGLNGRLTRLERTIAPPPQHQCRSCGLRHVEPLTIDLVRRIIGSVSWMAPGPWSEPVEVPSPRLCLCDPCCGDPGDRWFARRSHGLPTDGASRERGAGSSPEPPGDGGRG